MKVDCMQNARDGTILGSILASGKRRLLSRELEKLVSDSSSRFLIQPGAYPMTKLTPKRTEFELNLPENYDIPLAFKFTNSTETPNFRAQIYVNGYQFGKYANNVGPQLEFPVPEGIINHQGKNSVGVSLWAMDKEGAKLEGLELVATALIQSGFGEVEASEQPRWKERKGAY